MTRRSASAGVLAALLVLVAACWPAGAALAAAPPALLAASFDHGARLGGSTALRLGLDIDPRRTRSPVTEVQLLYPKGLGLASSGLGLVSCVRPASDFQQVLIGSDLGLAGCSPNAVLGYGTARADVFLLGNRQHIPEYATLSVLAGPFQHGALGLVVFVDGDHPFGAKLAYAGALAPPSGPFGGGLAVHVPAIPSIADLATVSLLDLRLAIGSRAITYYAHVAKRTGAYHPDGIALPTRCPTHGFHFRAKLTFQDGSHADADSIVPCAQILPAASG